jgi:APA family basic amino acid/polyamine antiporter
MGGWHHATYLAGETVNPQKTVPRAMVIGTLVVTIVYVLAIFSYMCVLDINTMQSSSRVAADMFADVWSFGEIFVSVAIIISITGTIGIYTMTAPRIYFAMAEDKIFFRFLSIKSKTTGTPANAMLFQSAWATILILVWGSFIKVITFVTFMDIVFMAFACGTIFYFRMKKNDSASYKVPFYPYIPLIYMAVTLGFVLYTGWQLEWESVSGILILLAGIPVYYWFASKNKK